MSDDHTISFDDDPAAAAAIFERIVAWCNAVVGERDVDWDFRLQQGTFIFRRHEDVVMFNLVWCISK